MASLLSDAIPIAMEVQAMSLSTSELEVIQWLESIGLERYQQNFVSAEIFSLAIVTEILSAEELEELGIPKFSARALMKHIVELKANGITAPPPEESAGTKKEDDPRYDPVQWGPSISTANSRKIVLDASLEPLAQAEKISDGREARPSIPNGFSLHGQHDLQMLIDAGAKGRSHTSYLDYLLWAFTHHRPIVFSPDFVFFEALAIVAQSFAKPHVMDFYKKKWAVPDDAEIEFVTTICGQLDLGSMISAIEESNVFPVHAETFMPHFSTTTLRSRMAAMSCFCDIVSTMVPMRGGGCGLPWVRLDGNASDWAQLAERLNSLADVFTTHADYLHGVSALATEIATMLAEDREEDLTAYFREFLKTESDDPCQSGHGAVRVCGWINNLYNVESFHQGNITQFPQLVSKVFWTDERAPDKSFVAFNGVFGSIDREGLPVPDFGHMTFAGPADATETREKRMRLKRCLQGGEMVAEALGTAPAVYGKVLDDESDGSMLAPGRFFICGAHGMNLQAKPDGGVALHVNKLRLETWTLQDAGNGKFFICGAHGKNLQAKPDGGVALHVNRQGWETWTFEDAGNGKFFICGAHGKNLQAKPDGGVALHVNKQGWETWTCEPLANWKNNALRYM